jgi:hypothetical protein
MNPAQLKAAITTMKQDMNNVTASFQDQISSTKDDISSLGSTPGGTTSGTGGSVVTGDDADFNF